MVLSGWALSSNSVTHEPNLQVVIASCETTPRSEATAYMHAWMDEQMDEQMDG